MNKIQLMVHWLKDRSLGSCFLLAGVRLPRKTGLLVSVPGSITVWTYDLHPSVPWCFWVLKRCRNLSIFLQRCEDLLKIWFTSSVKECGETFHLGKDAPRVDRLFQCL